MVLAPAMTWKLVTMCPSRSQMNPDPEPCGTSKRFIDQKSLCRARVVMKTTDGEAVSKTAMVARSSGSRSPGGGESLGANAFLTAPGGRCGLPSAQEMANGSAGASSRRMPRSRRRTVFLLEGSESTRSGGEGQKPGGDRHPDYR